MNTNSAPNPSSHADSLLDAVLRDGEDAIRDNKPFFRQIILIVLWLEGCYLQNVSLRCFRLALLRSRAGLASPAARVVSDDSLSAPITLSLTVLHS